MQNQETLSEQEKALLSRPPYSLEAEQAVLGGLMLDNRTFELIADMLNSLTIPDKLNGKRIEQPDSC